jgi:predicted Zn-dependent protease with MMP-like domain
MNLKNMKKQIKKAMDEEKAKAFKDITDEVVRLIKESGYDEVLKRLGKK